MNNAFLTKLFHFSASFSRNNRIEGHNYTLSVTVEFSDALDESELEKKINSSLIHKIHSRDLTLHVDFLKNIDISDINLLRVFSAVISPAINPVKLHSLSLERDARTKITAYVSALAK